MAKKVLRSVGAILAGIVVGVVLSLLTDAVLEAFGVFPSAAQQAVSGFFVWWMVLLALIYRCVYTGLGGYVTAKLAPNNVKRHVLIIGLIALLANAIGLIVTWNMNLGPSWYPIGLTLLALPSTLLGGKLAE